MENEIMNYEEQVMEPEYEELVETETEESGIGTGLAMAIGAGLAIATTAAVKFGKKLWAGYKAKKEAQTVTEHDFVEPTDEEIKAVTK